MGAGGVLPGVRGWVQPRLCCRHRAEQLLPRSALRRLCLKLEELESIVCKYRPRLAFRCAGTSQRAPTLSQHAEPAGQAPSPGCEAVVAGGTQQSFPGAGGLGDTTVQDPPGSAGSGWGHGGGCGWLLAGAALAVCPGRLAGGAGDAAGGAGPAEEPDGAGGRVQEHRDLLHHLAQ